jgi:hypothetical protein
LLTILGGMQVMIESPLIQEIVACTKHDMILQFLEGRFGAVPADVAMRVRRISDEDKLRELTRYAARCSGPEAFQAEL